MALDSLSSPPGKSHNKFFAFPMKKQITNQGELDSWSTLLDRHRFLLTMMVLLAFLCSIYLYFAATLGDTDLCSGLYGAEKALCEAKSQAAHTRKFRFF